MLGRYFGVAAVALHCFSALHRLCTAAFEVLCAFAGLNVTFGALLFPPALISGTFGHCCLAAVLLTPQVPA